VADRFQDKYRIPSARWQNWDYSWNGAYFITICTAHRECVFGKIVNEKMAMSDLGILANNFWYEITKHCNTVELDAFVVMPNHVHGIIILTGNEKTGIDELGCHYDDGDAVETRHALSPFNTNANHDRDMVDDEQETRHALSLLNMKADKDIHDCDNETRHALSLQPPRQNAVKPGQRRFRNQGKQTISSIVGSYKSAVSKHANRLGLNFDWQPRFHDHIIRNDGAYQRIAEYIQNNPDKWQEDQFYME